MVVPSSPSPSHQFSSVKRNPRWVKPQNGSEVSSDSKNTDPSSSSSQPAVAAAVAAAQPATSAPAAEVARLTSSGRAISTSANATTTPATRTTSFGTAHVSGSGTDYGSREERAAFKIQSHFGAYLLREDDDVGASQNGTKCLFSDWSELSSGVVLFKDLRALKAIVKLQALVRGRIVRKHIADEHIADVLRQMQAMLRAKSTENRRTCIAELCSSSADTSTLSRVS